MNPCQNNIPLMILHNKQVFDDYKKDDISFKCKDVLFKIFWTCLDAQDKSALCNLGYASKYHYTMFMEFVENKISFEQFYSMLSQHCNKITFLDREILQYTGAIPILCTNFRAINEVEHDAGATAFHYKESNLQDLCAKVKELGQNVEELGLNIEISERQRFFDPDKSLPLTKPCFSIVTNGIFKKTRNMALNNAKKLLNEEYKCEMVTARQVLCTVVRVYESTNGEKILFAPNSENKPTYTFTSSAYRPQRPKLQAFTSVGMQPGTIFIDWLFPAENEGEDNYGMMGQWSFSIIKKEDI